MDISSHVFPVIVILFATGYSAFIPFGVLGAVILDIDILFTYFSYNHPSLYILTHGGFTHSMLGAVVMAFIAFLLTLDLYKFSNIQENLPIELPLFVFFFIIVGAFLHLLLDYLASPGIPLFYPITEKKYGLGLFPIPIFLFLALLSLTFLVLFIFHKITLPVMGVLTAVFIGCVAVCGCLRFYVSLKTNG